MGFKNRVAGTFFTILNGKFCQRVDANAEGAVQRVNKVGKTVHEIFHDSFVGKLAKIDVTSSDAYGKSWVFTFVSEGNQTFNLQLSYSNSFAVAFLKMLPNIDLSKEMEVTPSSKVVDGKTQSSLFIKQDGANIKHAYTKDNPNGMPDLEKKIIKGNEVWDDTLRLEFLEGMIRADVMPKLAMPAGAVAESADPNAVEAEEDATGEDPGF